MNLVMVVVGAGWTDAWAAALWRATVQGGIALALAWVITRSSARLPPAFKCWVWRLAYLKLIVALCWAAPIPLRLLPAVLPPVSVAGTTQVEFPASVEPADVQLRATPAGPAPTRTIGRAEPLFAAWGVGVSLLTLRLALGWRAARAIRRGSVAVDEVGLLEACVEVATAYGLRRPPPLARNPAVRSPLLLGPIRPLVVFPADAATRHSPDALRLMLAHELAHLKRRDLWWNWLAAVAQGLFFFHPLVWIAAREWRLAQESACDEAAVGATGTPPARYGDMLLALLSSTLPSCSRFAALPATAAAGVAESLSTVRRRLTAMKHFPAAPSRTRVRRAFACAIFVIGCTAIAPWSVVARQPDPDNAGRGDREAATSPGPAEAAQPDAEPVPAGAPAPAPAGRTTALGYLRSDEANLAAASEGIVTQVGAEVGQSVKKGQLVVKLNDRKAQLALQAAKAKLAEVNAKARRVKELYEAKQLSEAELERTTAEREQAQVELALREQDLEEMRVVSPLDGAVEKLSVRPGEFVARGGEVARVVALDAFWADVNVGTDTAAGIKPGDPAAVQLGRRQGRSLKGRVRFVSSVVRSGSQSTLVRVDVLGPPPGLKPGMEVVVEFGGGK